MSLHGTLETFALPDVLALLAATKKNGELHVIGGKTDGRVWFDAGHVVGADVGKARDFVDAVFQLLRLDTGKFSFDGDKAAPAPGDPTPVEPLLNQAQGRLAEWRTIEQVIPSLECGIAMAPEVREGPVTVTGEQWRALVGAAGAGHVHTVVDRLGLAEFDVCRILKDLVETGLLSVDTTRTVPVAEESRNGSTPAAVAPPAAGPTLTAVPAPEAPATAPEAPAEVAPAAAEVAPAAAPPAPSAPAADAPTPEAAAAQAAPAPAGNDNRAPAPIPAPAPADSPAGAADAAPAPAPAPAPQAAPAPAAAAPAAEAHAPAKRKIAALTDSPAAEFELEQVQAAMNEAAAKPKRVKTAAEESGEADELVRQVAALEAATAAQPAAATPHATPPPASYAAPAPHAPDAPAPRPAAAAPPGSAPVGAHSPAPATSAPGPVAHAATPPTPAPAPRKPEAAPRAAEKPAERPAAQATDRPIDKAEKATPDKPEAAPEEAAAGGTEEPINRGLLLKFLSSVRT